MKPIATVWITGGKGRRMRRSGPFSPICRRAAALQELYGSGYLNERNNAEADLLKCFLSGGLPGHLLSDYTMQNYDMSGDFWKLSADGRIVWDGKKDLVNEQGEVIRIDKVRFLQPLSAELVRLGKLGGSS